MILLTSLADHQQDQHSKFTDSMLKHLQHASRMAFSGLGVSMHEVPTAIEPQAMRPPSVLDSLPETVLPPRQKSESMLGRDVGRTRAMEPVQYASQSPMLGRLEFASGPIVELAYAKQLLEHEQVTRARIVLKRAIGKYPQDERLRSLYRAIAPGRVVRRDISYSDRRMEAAWIQAHQDQYRGKWVAILGEQVLGVADDLLTVLRCVREHHIDEPPLIHRFID